MKIGIANDHAATAMKKELLSWLEEKGYEVVNFGTDSEESTDYAIWAEKLANAVVSGEVERGIAICGTGIGIGIACNKVHGIRCATVSESASARLTRLHNNANIISFGARIIGIETAKEIVEVFLTTEFEGGRHQRRIDQIHAIEERKRK